VPRPSPSKGGVMSVATKRDRATELARHWRSRVEQVPVIGNLISQ
jgi:hypothetical protein